MNKILTHRFLGITLLAGVVFGIVVLFPVHIQSRKPFASANVAYAAIVTSVFPGQVFCDTPPDHPELSMSHRCVLEDVANACIIGLKSTPQNASQCDANDIIVLRQVASCSPNLTWLSTFTDVGKGRLCTDTQIQQSNTAAALYAGTLTSCSGLENFWANPLRCTGRVVSVFAGSLLISIGAWLLALADILFNWTVDNTILLFSTEVFAKVEGGVNAGWTAMRDIANIVIIGMFTFIAIATILGVAEYGAKKLLARVLIIAVLINFSLLFTKIIIDASNFTAAQFYASSSGYKSISEAQTAAAGRSGEAKGKNIVEASTLDTLNDFSNTGIAGAFINFLKVTSVINTFDALNTTAETSSGGGWTALAHGILAATLLGGAAFVLFYGSYLLISRAVLFIFLMVTAAGAFATHLIPKMNESKYGWEGWWSSLLHNAALAPFLMIFLWITLKVASGIQEVQGGTLGNLASPNSTGADINTLFSYLIILGLLWGSFMLASKWASKVGGLGFTGMLMSSATVGTAALASRFIAAPIMRTTFGRGATARSMVLESDVKGKVQAASLIKDKTSKQYKDALAEITAKMKEKDKWDRLAKGSFNLPNTKLAQMGMKSLGVPSFITGAQTKPKGFADMADERAKNEIAKAEKLIQGERDINQEDYVRKNRESEFHKRRMRDLRRSARDLRDAATALRDTNELQKQPLNQRRGDAENKKVINESALVTAKQERDIQATVLVNLAVDKERADMSVEQATAKRTDIQTTSDRNIAALTIAANKPGLTGTDKQGAERALATAQENQARNLTEQDAKIADAKTNASVIQQRIAQGQARRASFDADIKKAETAIGEADVAIKDVKAEIKKLDDKFDEADKTAKEVEDKLTPEGETQMLIDDIQTIAGESGTVAGDIAVKRTHERWMNIIPAVLREKPENDVTARKTRSLANKMKKNFWWKQRLIAENELNRDAGGGETTSTGSSAAPSPAPSAPTSK